MTKARWVVKLVPDEDGTILVRCRPPVPSAPTHYGTISRSGEVLFNRPLDLPRRVLRRAHELARHVDASEEVL
jgi:hypothetical protein